MPNYLSTIGDLMILGGYAAVSSIVFVACALLDWAVRERAVIEGDETDV